MNLSNFVTNRLIDGQYRGGALTGAGAAGSAAVVKGIWTATTAYVVGDVVVPISTMTGAGGKFLRCTTAGTTGSTATLAVPNPGSTLTDGSVTWTAVSGIPCDLARFVSLLTVNKGLRANTTAYALNDCISLTATGGGASGDLAQHLYKCTTAGTTAGAQGTLYQGVDTEVITDGTAVFTELSTVLKTGTGFPAGLAEVSGGSYARVKIEAGAYPALTDYAATQGGSTASTGTTAASSNSNAVTFPTSSAAWTAGAALIAAFEYRDQLTAGNLLGFGVLATPQAVGASGNTPSFAAGQLTIKQDN